MRLEGKTAVITGAGAGMGLSMAKRFAQEGANVVVGDWIAERVDAAVAEIQGAGGKAVGLQGNVADKASAEALIDLAVKTYGGMHVVCSNAGIMDYMQGVGELSDEVWRKVLDVNLNGAMLTCRKAVQHMREHGGGSIVITASIAGYHGGAAGVAYTVSKHALIGLTRSTAWMYANQNIRCNVICPGATETKIAETMPPDKLDPHGIERTGGYAALIPAILQPSDIASLALYLASDESRYINGAIIPADGGWTAA